MSAAHSQKREHFVVFVLLAWLSLCYGSTTYANSTSSTSPKSITSSSKISSDSTTVETLTESVIPILDSTSSSGTHLSLSQSISSVSSHHATTSSTSKKSSSLSILHKSSSSSPITTKHATTSPSSHSSSLRNSSATSSSHHPMITPAPAWNPWTDPWGNHSWGTTWPWSDQTFKTNTCSNTSNTASPFGTCSVVAGTMHLSYFPPQSANVTYPTTHWASEISTMMTSPSIYMIVSSVHAANQCGPLGPTYTEVVFAVHPSALSTLQPYKNAAATTRIGPARVLTMSDIVSGCSKGEAGLSKGQTYVTHPTSGLAARCNPQVVWPSGIMPLGGPFWQGCVKYKSVYGIYDPPGSVPPVQGLFSTTANSMMSSTSDGLAPAPTSTLEQASPTVSAAITSNAEAPQQSSPPSAVLNSSSVGPLFVNVESTGIVVIGSDLSSTYYADPTDASEVESTAVIATPVDNPAIILSSASPGDSAVIASNIVIAGQTVSLGGPAVTVASSVIQLTPSGIVVYDEADGLASTIAVPTQIAGQEASPTEVTIAGQTATVSPVVVSPSSNIAGGQPMPIATVEGTIVSASPGATTVVIKGQTATIGGPPITIPGTNIVATLSPSDLIVQYPGGVVSTYALPTGPSLPAAELTGQAMTVAGQAITIPKLGASTIILGTQTLGVGGPPITLGGSNVITLSPSGLIVQYPNGGITTLAVPTGSYQAVATVGPTSTATSTNGVAGLIASIMGITTPAGLSSSAAISTTPSDNAQHSVQSGIATSLGVAPGSAGPKTGVQWTNMICWICGTILLSFYY